ncbi:MAG TPA: hypothetical protein VIG33_12070 [Pseudobdellovibrionaceae bacterium]|jgi:hypothetical protein
MKYVFALSTLLFATHSFAVLPPYWDSVRQIEAVIHSTELSGKIHGPITNIKNISNLTYEVSTQSCRATVVLDIKAPTQPGAASYSVKLVSEAICLSLYS